MQKGQYIAITIMLLAALFIPESIINSKNNDTRKKKNGRLPFWIRLDKIAEGKYLSKFILKENDFLIKDMKETILTCGIKNLSVLRFQVISLIVAKYFFIGQVIIYLSNTANILMNQKTLESLAKVLQDDTITAISFPNIPAMIIISMISYFFPFFAIMLVRVFREKKAEKEAIMLQTYTLMLLNTKKNVRYILKVLYERSSIYKNVLRDCINTYSLNSEKALYDLKNSVDKPEFQSLVNALEKSLFNDREVSIKYLKNGRKIESNIRQITNQKRNKSKQIAGAILLILPIGTLCMVGGYPWLLWALKMMGDLNAI